MGPHIALGAFTHSRCRLRPLVGGAERHAGPCNFDENFSRSPAFVMLHRGENDGCQLFGTSHQRGQGRRRYFRVHPVLMQFRLRWLNTGLDTKFERIQKVVSRRIDIRVQPPS